MRETAKNIFSDMANIVRFVWHVVCDTLFAVLKDPGVMIIFIVACLAYPVIYNLIYHNNTLREVPIAIVDKSGSPESVRFIRKLDATPDVNVMYRCTSMLQAEKLLKAQKIHGIIYFPAEYEQCIETARDAAHISLYCDMTSFLYMKTVYMATNMVMLDEMHTIQIDRYCRMGYTEEFAWELVQEAQYTDVKLFNPTDGYGSFLTPAVLVMIIHQTLFFGICMLKGTYYEEKRKIFTVNAHHFTHALLATIGMAIAFLLIYLALGTIDLIIFPHLFNLPHVGSPWHVLQFMIPFILATTFFSLTVANFIHNRETGMLLLLSTSLIFLFISGVSWPQPSLPKPWRILSYFFPSTWGIHGYLHITTMGTDIAGTLREFNALCYLTIIYFITATIGLYATLKTSSHRKRIRVKLVLE